MENNIEYVAYLRVSTQKQGYSGLGLDAQKDIIRNYLSDKNPIAEFLEVESGRKTDKGRPKLKEALEICRKTGAKLIVAKLDRLARNVSFLSQLLESDVDIVFCDFPQANKMVLHILAAISQYEAELIATRTKQALAAKKAKGCTLGNPEHLIGKLDEAVAKSVETNKRKAEENPNNKRAAAMLKVLAKEGRTLQEMADYLNEQGFTTSKGYRFSRSSVYVLLKRYQINTNK
jgi:DNA invertase Pin-like site-specific DNA recombinase